MISGTGSTLFEELGFYYIGPVDGHNLEDLIDVLQGARRCGARVVRWRRRALRGLQGGPAHPAAFIPVAHPPPPLPSLIPLCRDQGHRDGGPGAAAHCDGEGPRVPARRVGLRQDARRGAVRHRHRAAGQGQDQGGRGRGRLPRRVGVGVRPAVWAWAVVGWCWGCRERILPAAQNPRRAAQPLPRHPSCTLASALRLLLQCQSYTNYFADALVAEASKDARIVGIHAAMGGGTGMNRFEKVRGLEGGAWAHLGVFQGVLRWWGGPSSTRAVPLPRPRPPALHNPPPANTLLLTRPPPTHIACRRPSRSVCMTWASRSSMR